MAKKGNKTLILILALIKTEELLLSKRILPLLPPSPLKLSVLLKDDVRL